MKHSEPVSGIMTRNVLHIDVNDSLHEAERLMTVNHIRHIPVTDSGKLVGMLSLNDLLRLNFVESYGADEEAIDASIYDMLSIDQIMVSHPRSVEHSTSIADVARVFVERDFHALPVVDGDQLAGIVTTTDVIRYFLEKN